MAPGNDVVCSQPPTDVTIATKRQRLTTSTISLTSSPSLPFDLIPEILCRIPVKLLLQLKCVCKSWKSLISDPKFAKKQLRVSNTCHHLIAVTDRDSLLWDTTISSIFSDASTTNLAVPKAIKYDGYNLPSSCHGILLFPINRYSAILWNPSIRTLKILPRLLELRDYEKLDDSKLVIYNSTNDTFKISKIQNMNDWRAPQVYVESLISPCS